ncbi:MAG: mechanosensitive ion channel protein MscS [Cyanobacteria bacterium J007]|nr:MAG: mechanosensitive ion channel protein MscS [Cyanobacteria bacterium J007]
MKAIADTLLEFLKNLIDRELLRIGDIPISLGSIFQLILSFLLIIFITQFLKKFLKHKLLVRLGIDEGNREPIAIIISYGIGTLGFLIILQTNGFNLASLAVLAGGLGVGIGLGLQDLTKNFTSGLTILLERKLKVGDFISFGGLSGYVREISLRSTIIRTREGGDVVVPNSELVENQILNWSYDSFIARIHIAIGVAYGSDPVLVTETLLNCAYMEPAVLHNPAPKAMFMGFGDSALNFELWVWVNRIDLEPYIRSSLNFIIEYNLRAVDISIPFPQRDLWLRNPETLIPVSRRSKDLTSDRLEIPQQNPPTVKPPKPLALKDLLRQVTYFQNFTELELRQLIETGYRKRLLESQILFREGDPGDAFYIILSGSVEVYVEKIKKHLTNLGSGKFFGELALMLGIPRTASIRALEDTILFTINRQSFEKILREHPDLYEAIVQEFGKHQEELAQRQQELRALGLVDAAEDDKNPVAWVRKRLKNLFSLS